MSNMGTTSEGELAITFSISSRYDPCRSDTSSSLNSRARSIAITTSVAAKVSSKLICCC